MNSNKKVKKNDKVKEKDKSPPKIFSKLENEFNCETIDSIPPFYTVEKEMENRMNKSIERFIFYSQFNQDKTKDKKPKAKINQEIDPLWYQELSKHQIDAADSLYEVLIDDIEEGTVYRSLQVLKLMGIYPIVNSTQIRYALIMCRGNDITFLWCLMKLLYERCPHSEIKKYSINERIIMSCICHLDMIPTLKELDRILIPHKSKHIPPKEKLKLKTNCQCKILSPYLEPLTIKSIPQSKKFPPIKKPGYNFEAYERYKDPKFVLLSEPSRWYVQNTANENDSIFEGFDQKKILDYVCHSNYRLSIRKYKDIKLLFLNTRCHCNDQIHNSKYVVARERISPMELENTKTKIQYKKIAKLYYKQTTLKIIFRNIIHYLPEMKNIKICTNCKDCINDYKKYLSLLNKNNCKNNNFFDPNNKKSYTKNKRPSPTAGFQYDYEKIFKDAYFIDPDKNSLLLAQELDRYATEENSLTICLRYFWKFEIPFWYEETNDISDDDNELPSYQKLELKKNTNPKKAEITQPQIKNMLKDAIRKMSKNASFVLVKLPKVYNLKFLNAWMLTRYGHKYTDKERNSEIPETKSIIIVNLPQVEHICDTAIVDYDYRKRIGKSASHIVKNFHRELKSQLIDNSLLYWSALGPSMGSTRIRDVFYAYMPSSEYDIFPFRPPNPKCDQK